MSLVGIDWGGSNLRAFRFGAEGALSETRASPLGVSRLDGRSFEDALESVIGDWLPAEILVCGMAGTRGAWREAPYVPCPAALDQVAARLETFETRLGPVRMVPGLSTLTAGGLNDVLRGEETQIFGAVDPAATALVIAPGTHSKWCRVSAGRIEGFRTWMTGELFAVLAAHSILGRLMRGRAHDEDAFVRGVSFALEDPDIAGLLFSVRGEALLGRLEPQASAAYLSGLLIGAEVRSGLSANASAPIILIAAEALADRYRTALSLAGEPPQRIVDGAEASAAGLSRISGFIHNSI
jgi:2-dehydro-3-deoxygalactonokinase